MFDKNDKTLFAMRVICIVTIIVLAAISTAIGILLIVAGYVGAGIILIALFLFCCWLFWVYNRLHISYLCDIKLIRNKLYGVENGRIRQLYTDDEYSADEELRDLTNDEEREARRNRSDERDFKNYGESLERLHAAGAIHDSEYEKLAELFYYGNDDGASAAAVIKEITALYVKFYTHKMDRDQYESSKRELLSGLGE